MARWEPDAQGRLQQAAIELFLERGYDATSVALISRRAGLTERTFFRYFPNKREVLFTGSQDLQAFLVEQVRQAAPATAPMEVVFSALAATGSFFEQRGDFARARQAAITANPELQERELHKLATLAAALAGTLRERAVPQASATLAAEVGVAVFRVAFERWTDGRTGRPRADDLSRIVRTCAAELQDVVGTSSTTPAPAPGRPAGEMAQGPAGPQKPGNARRRSASRPRASATD